MNTANKFDNYYRSLLSKTEQRVYDMLRHNWSAQYHKSIFSPLSIPEKDYSKIVTAVALDHPELFWVNYYQYTISQNMFSTILEFNFFYSEQEIRRLCEEAGAWRTRILSQIPDTSSERWKIWLLFDYLARQVTYGDCGIAQSHTIVGVFRKQTHVAVCEGIAKSFKYLCDALKIPCLIVCGQADLGLGNYENHAWNLIQYENGCRHLDVTAELTSAQHRGNARLDNFLYTDCKMNNYHWDHFAIPPCI